MMKMSMIELMVMLLKRMIREMMWCWSDECYCCNTGLRSRPCPLLSPRSMAAAAAAAAAVAYDQ